MWKGQPTHTTEIWLVVSVSPVARSMIRACDWLFLSQGGSTLWVCSRNRTLLFIMCFYDEFAFTQSNLSEVLTIHFVVVEEYVSPLFYHPCLLWLIIPFDWQASGYSSVVPRPMWLEKVRENLDGRYRLVGEFISDVRLIFKNCAVYNRVSIWGTWLIISLIFKHCAVYNRVSMWA